MSNTPNHNYNIPERGTTDWDILLNENFQDIDSDITIRDEDSNRVNYTPELNKKFESIDSGTVYYGNGDNWIVADRDINILSAEEIKSKRQNNDLYASRFPGTTLAEKVENALEELIGSSGSIIVTPRDDGKNWSWGKDLTIDPTRYTGLSLLFRDNVFIKYPGTGWAITIDVSESKHGSQVLSDRTRIEGGIWQSTGTDPNGWLRTRDMFMSYICPRAVGDFSNSSGNGTAIRIENNNMFSAHNEFGKFSVIGTDIGLDFVGARVTGGTGTDGFKATKIAGLTGKVYNYGIRVRGDMHGSIWKNPMIFPAADNVVCYHLDGSFNGTTFISLAAEETPADYTNTIGIETGKNYSKAVHLIGGIHNFTNIDTPISRYDSNHAIYTLQRDGVTLSLGDIDKTMIKVDKNGFIRFQDQDGSIFHDRSNQWEDFRDRNLIRIGSQVDAASFENEGGFDIIGITDQDPSTDGGVNAQWVKIRDPDGGLGYIRVFH